MRILGYDFVCLRPATTSPEGYLQHGAGYARDLPESSVSNPAYEDQCYSPPKPHPAVPHLHGKVRSAAAKQRVSAYAARTLPP